MEEGKRILIVEDEDVARVLYRRLLDRMPHRYEIASTLAEARSLLSAADRCDLLVTDVRLPDGRGTDLLAEFLRKFPAGKALVVTGSPDLEAIVHDPLPEMGVEKIYKPFEIDEFLGALRRLLQ